MFDIDKWQEIFYTIWKNKLRTFLTGLSVYWGIFMLMFMLGAGDGLENGVKSSFEALATNSCFMWGQRTSMAHQGLKPGRSIDFDNRDMEAIKQQVKEIEYLAPKIRRSGLQSTVGVNSGAYDVRGDTPEYQKIEPMKLTYGRWINALDIEKSRKVVVIGDIVAQELFEPESEEDYEALIGQYFKVGGVFFQVIGVFKSLRNNERGIRDEQTMTIPLSTMQRTFSSGSGIDYFCFTANPSVSVSQLEQRIEGLLRKRYKIHPDDNRAIGSENLEEEFSEIQGLFVGINALILMVGIGTLLAGLIGVSNIMLIVVKERTKEIGLRKAMGATPGSIISLVLQESVFITLVAGYLGLLVGVGLIEVIRATGVEGEFFSNPQIDFQVASMALLFMIIAGALAGFFPALLAARVSPVEALRDE